MHRRGAARRGHGGGADGRRGAGPIHRLFSGTGMLHLSDIARLYRVAYNPCII